MSNRGQTSEDVTGCHIGRSPFDDCDGLLYMDLRGDDLLPLGTPQGREEDLAEVGLSSQWALLEVLIGEPRGRDGVNVVEHVLKALLGALQKACRA